jgi:glucosamine-6-phosphate deaminase
MNIYDFDFYCNREKSPIPFEIFETDIDLYYALAFSLYLEIEKNNQQGKNTVVILPVGPVFQYQRFIYLCRKRPLDLSRLNCFFMDEYLGQDKKNIDISNPLSFRGFIKQEFIDPMPEEMKLNQDQIFFPDPIDPSVFDEKLTDLGNADICYAGVGITGHLAFNEPPAEQENVSIEDFGNLPSRVLKLSRETITINSNTAMRGAFEKIPKYAVTIGFKQILNSKKIRIYLNRPWQSSGVRKILFAPISPSFPATLVRNHQNVKINLTREVATKPEFALK